MFELNKAPILKGKIEVLSGFAFPSSGFNQLDGLPLIRIRDLGGSTTEVRFRGVYDPAYRVSKGDLLVAMDGDFEVHRWEGEDALLNQRVCRISSTSREIDQGFLYWYLKPKIAEIHRRTPQTTVRHLSTKDIYSIAEPPIGFPAQKRISQILDTLDTAIRETEALIDKLKAIKQGLLHDLLTRGIDANGQLRPLQSEAPQLYKESPLGWIPKEWDIVNVREAGEVKLGRQRSPNHEHGQYMRPYFRVANVYDGFIDFTDVLEMNFSPSEQEVYSVRPGDILLNEGQSLELVGRCALYEGQPGIYCFQNTLVRFRANENTVPEYAQLVFKYWLDTGCFTHIAKQTTSIAHLGADRFADMPFPSPNAGEQVLIVERLQALTCREAAERLELQKLRQQKSGLMDDLLTCRVRVTPLLESMPQSAAPSEA
ncbi:restriction endonuclease subunit S [Pseudomonas donghuensis]|uniref:restriction endonuclease subunit S n=1 Tax=Pseudomonas donghuensis TaxID=1163398 RepID=UPI0020C31C1E|nr:restriction endonuclease subunit S [Pseudomonas donghuensis]MCP6698099.1 restriction endonuclease subunit S [Pseudomonas donghuensis]